MIKDMNKNDIKFETEKINVYMFWGNGCPHCDAMKSFLDNLDDSYKNKFNLYTFEVWYNVENASLLGLFSNFLNDNPKYVPYLIIGKRVFAGYSESMNDDIKDAINNNFIEKYDIYEELKKHN